MILSGLILGASVVALCPRSLPAPSVSELGGQLSAAGFADLSAKVRGRADAACTPVNEVTTACIIGDQDEVYTFTEDGHPAHPSAFYRGFSGRALEQRGWTVTPGAEADAFFARAADSIVQPIHPNCAD